MLIINMYYIKYSINYLIDRTISSFILRDNFFNINASRIVSEELKFKLNKFPANCPSSGIFPNKLNLSGPRLKTGCSRI